MISVAHVHYHLSYGLSVRRLGQIVAVDAAGGKMRWSTQGREGENASILGGPSWLLASTTDGSLVIARANPQTYEEVRRYQVADSAMWAYPAISGSAIIVKDEKWLHLLQLEEAAKPAVDGSSSKVSSPPMVGTPTQLP